MFLSFFIKLKHPVESHYVPTRENHDTSFCYCSPNLRIRRIKHQRLGDKRPGVVRLYGSLCPCGGIARSHPLLVYILQNEEDTHAPASPPPLLLAVETPPRRDGSLDRQEGWIAHPPYPPSRLGDCRVHRRPKPDPLITQKPTNIKKIKKHKHPFLFLFDTFFSSVQQWRTSHKN